jgi:hypothetical protein
VKNSHVNRLQNNQKFFKEICEEKLKTYLEQIKFEIKAQVYDKVIKHTLYHIYKHYDNLHKKSDSQCAMSFQEQIGKTKEQGIQLRQKQEQLEMTNNLDQQKLEMMINDPQCLRSNVDIVQSISSEEMQTKLEQIKQSNLSC